MNRTRIIFLCLLFFSPIGVTSALAHRPDGNEQPITLVEDSQISYAFYRELSDEKTMHIFQVSVKSGELFHAGINIPKLPGLENYGVNMALIGYGLEIEDIQNILGEKGLDISDKYLIEIFDSNSTGMLLESEISEDFYEPFTQTSFFGRQSLGISIPSNGEYFIVIWHPEELAGKFVLDTGTKEEFGFSDLLLFPKWWWDSQIYFERDGKIITGLLISVTLLTSSAIFFKKS